jgi:hypothetical protein
LTSTRAGIGAPAASTIVPCTRPVGDVARRDPIFTSRHELTGPPPIGATSSVIGPVRFETNANDLPSGATAGENSPIGSLVMTNGLPPAAGTIAMSFDPRSSEPKRNALPSGVHCGFMRYSDSS